MKIVNVEWNEQVFVEWRSVVVIVELLIGITEMRGNVSLRDTLRVVIILKTDLNFNESSSFAREFERTCFYS